MNKVILSGHIVVAESELIAVREALPIHIKATRAEKGCIVFNVVEHMMEIGRFDVYEEFETSDAFRFHQNRVQKSEWGVVSKNVVRHYRIEGFDESKALEDDESSA